MNYLMLFIAMQLFHHPLGIGWRITNLNDSGEGSFREAVNSSRSGDFIIFDDSLKGRTIELTTGSILINRNLEIYGNSLTITRTGDSRFRIFDIQAGTVIMHDLTISNGYADGSFGGGIFNRGTLSLNDCHVTQNISDAGDGGGGIYNLGNLTIQRSVIDFNQAIFTFGFPVGYGGGIKSAGLITLIGSTVTHNTATLQGGGIYCNGMLDITLSTVSGNSAPEGANIYGCTVHRIHEISSMR